MSTPERTNENKKSEPTTPRDASATAGGTSSKSSTTTDKQADRATSKTGEDVNEDDNNTKTR